MDRFQGINALNAHDFKFFERDDSNRITQRNASKWPLHCTVKKPADRAI